MQHFQVASTNVSDGQVELTFLNLVDDGTSTDIPDARIYISPNSSSTLPPDAVLIGSSGPWNGSPVSVALTGNTIITTVPQYIYVVYDIGQHQEGKTIQSRVSAVHVLTPDIGAGDAGSSNQFTIESLLKIWFSSLK